jgi:hypothetical protein
VGPCARKGQSSPVAAMPAEPGTGAQRGGTGGPSTLSMPACAVKPLAAALPAYFAAIACAVASGGAPLAVVGYRVALRLHACSQRSMSAPNFPQSGAVPFAMHASWYSRYASQRKR